MKAKIIFILFVHKCKAIQEEIFKMKINAAEQIQESVVERLQKEKELQDQMKFLTRRSIFKNIERVKSSKLPYRIKRQIDGIQEFETLNAILGEIWNVKDFEKIEAIIDKYDWLEEIKRLEEE
jgi:hypothetical protein